MDKYQGQQNEYVLLSLVRSRAVGHIRDVRRLVVAMSRARLGLYVFGRLPLFANCFELQPTMQLFLERPTQLALHPTEYTQVQYLLRVPSYEHFTLAIPYLSRERQMFGFTQVFMSTCLWCCVRCFSQQTA